MAVDGPAAEASAASQAPKVEVYKQPEWSLRLTESALYREDAFREDHTSVWGSWYDPTLKNWGYVCCKSTVKNACCSAAAATKSSSSRSKRDAEEDDDDPRAKAARVRFWAGKLLDGEPPAEPPAPRETFDCAEEFLAAFVLYWFHAWAGGGGAASRPDAKVAQATKEALLPLLQQLRERALQPQLLGQLADFAELAAKREYSQANDVYVGITIGKALWHSHLDLGQQRAHWGGGCSLRTMQKQVVEKDHKNATLFDTDPAVQRYVHAMKRLVTHVQTVAPSEDPSKMGHVTAPAAHPSECGLPVHRNIRDTDGQGRVPEYVEPSELSSYSKDNAHRLQFGQDRGGHAHPFQGIGNARGV